MKNKEIMFDITFPKRILLFGLFLCTAFISLAQTSSVSLSVTWPQWAGENRVQIYNPSGTLIYTYCAPGNCYNGANVSHSNTINLGCLPNGNNYSAVLTDRYGDGWNGSTANITITSAGTTVVNTNFTSGSTKTVTFNVSGGTSCLSAPEIDITSAGNSIADNSTAVTTTNNTDFGKVSLGSFIDKKFNIVNSGNATLNLSGTPIVQITGANAADFSFIILPSTTVAAGSSTSFTVRYNRSTIGISNATITIANNDSDENPYNFNIRAETINPLSTFYYENFDNGAAGWVSSSSGPMKWTLGRNATEQGEGDYWYTDSWDNYSKGRNFTLTSPNISTVGFRNITFKLDFATITGDAEDGMQIEYSANGGLTWSVLGTVGSGFNWYNEGDIDGIANNAPGWARNSSILGAGLSKFEEATHELPTILENNPLVQFRVRFASANDNVLGDGVMIDNIIMVGSPNTTQVAPEGPANVKTDLTLWLESKTIPSTNGTVLSTWIDRALDNDAFEIPANAPTFTNNTVDNVNFNPTVTFNRATGKHMRGKGGFNSNDYWIVVRSSLDISRNGADETLILGAKEAAVSPTKDPSGIGWGPVSARYSNEVLAHSVGTVSESDPANGSYGRAFTSTSKSFDDVNIINVKNNATNTETEIYVNGKKLDNATGRTTITNQLLNFAGFANKPFYLGVGRYTLNGEPFESHLNGQVTEVFSFSSKKDAAVQQRIYSYLAIKNGVSLQSPTSTETNDHRATWDYLNSANGVIWNYAANTAYNYDVAGIGRDDDSQLVQRQSQSENSTSVVAIGLNTVEDLGTTNTQNFQNDRDFLIWGHNGQDMTQTTTPLSITIGTSNPVTISMSRVKRTWKIAEVSTVDISKTQIRVATSDFAGLGPLAVDEQYLLIISNTDAFSSNVQTEIFTENGAFQYANYKFNNTQFFTIGKVKAFKDDRSLVLDGVNDYIEISNGSGLGSIFSASAWVKSDGANASGTDRAIVAKRNGASGFEMYLNPANKVVVYWNNGSNQILTSNTTLNNGTWRYLATTFDGSILKLYIDGVLDKQQTLSAPIPDSNILTLGARKENNGSVIHNWNGELDEIRMWDVVLSQSQVRYLMNQELVDNIGFVNGNTIPASITKNEVATIPWNKLKAYYSMNSFIGASLNDESTSSGYGTLNDNNFYDLKTQSAPVPYKTVSNGNWENTSVWKDGAINHIPGSTRVINGVTSFIDWNIVRTTNQVDINNAETTLLGLLVNSNQLNVNNDHGLTVTHYLNLNGTIDLRGESQLVQTLQSDLEKTSTGKIERDQQGTSDPFNYNYWSSPVSTINATANNTNWTINTVLKDGTVVTNPRNLNFSSSVNGATGNMSTAATISSYWLYKYGNLPSGVYANWQYAGQNAAFKVGEGWTMKGTGTAASNQNYVFVGKPNNGDITLPLNAGNNYLIGNPYPSAIDADTFIGDNPQLDGTLYFWEHWSGNSHILKEYQGGYAMYNYSGGVGNATFGTNHPGVNSGGIPTKKPGRYIPVAQGFFVNGISNGTIKFSNTQRIFRKEASGISVFVSAPGSDPAEVVNPNQDIDNRFKIRLGINTPAQIHRQLLLTVDSRTTMGYDRGFDGQQFDAQTDDMSFVLGDKKLSIQGIPSVANDLALPLSIKLKNGGSVTIMLDDVENLPTNQIIFLKDALTNTYSNLLNGSVTIDNLNAGNIDNRFSVVFAIPSTLSVDNEVIDTQDIIVYTPQNEKVVYIKKNTELNIKNITLLNMLGQEVKNMQTDGLQGTIAIPVEGIATGNYIINMILDNGIVTQKVIITN